MINEQCWVLKGNGKRRGNRYWTGKYDRYTEGQPALVAFDPDYVWENRDSIVGWIHTHPQWTANPSSVDHATMTAQVGSLGRPLVCVIQGTDGIRAWWYFDDESPGVEGKIKRIGKRLFGKVPKVKVTQLEVEVPEAPEAPNCVKITFANDDEVAEMEARYELLEWNIKQKEI